MSPDLEALANQAIELLQHVFEAGAAVSYVPRWHVQLAGPHQLSVDFVLVEPDDGARPWLSCGVGHDTFVLVANVDRLPNASEGLDWPRRMRQALSHALVPVMGWPPRSPSRPNDPHLTFPQAQVLLAAYARLWALAEAEAES